MTLHDAVPILAVLISVASILINIKTMRFVDEQNKRKRLARHHRENKREPV